MQMSLHPDFHHVHSLQTFTAFNSLPTSISYDFLEPDVSPRSFFFSSFSSFPFECFQCNWKHVGGRVTVVGCLRGVCWIMEGGFLWNEVFSFRFFWTTLSPAALTNHNAWCLHSLFYIDRLRLWAVYHGMLHHVLLGTVCEALSLFKTTLAYLWDLNDITSLCLGWGQPEEAGDGYLILKTVFKKLRHFIKRVK